MKPKTKPSWESVFAEFNTLQPETQRILRNAAAQSLINNGCGEIGSSDINHALYAARCLAESWTEVIINYANP